jgi:N-acetyl-gamma-glutamylphosphate reductase
VGSVEEGNDPLKFDDRKIEIDQGGMFGLMELLDNNPVMCAETISVPTAAQTLALIALGPLALAGLLEERPAFVTNAPETEMAIGRALQTAEWDNGVNLHVEPQDLGSVLVASAMAVIPAASSDDISDLYDERFGRSFFIQKAEPDRWSPSLVEKTPYAAYQLSQTSDERGAFVTIRVMADRDGKCGAAQIVHAMNVMCGFEESLGLT